MGSDFSKQICCGACGRCWKWEGTEESSETKPILQTSEEASACIDTQQCPPALQGSAQGSEEGQALSQDRGPSADPVEEKMETCSAVDPMGVIEGWNAAWDSLDFLAAPADGETKEVKVLTHRDNEKEREKVGNTEEKIKLVPDSEAQAVTYTAQDAKLAADKQQSEQAEAVGEDGPCAGIPLQESNVINFMEITSEDAAGHDSGIKPPAETGECLTGRNLPLCAVKVAEETETHLSAEHGEETGGAQLVELGPLFTEGAELTSLIEPTALLTVQATWEAREAAGPSEVVANGMAEMFSTAMPWTTLYPEQGPLDTAKQLLDFLLQETQSSVPAAQEIESLGCAEVSKVLHRSSDEDGVLGELEDEEIRGSDTETVAWEVEPQHGIIPIQTGLSEPLPYVQTPVQQEAEFLNVTPSLSEGSGSSGEAEAENIGA